VNDLLCKWGIISPRTLGKGLMHEGGVAFEESWERDCGGEGRGGRRAGEGVFQNKKFLTSLSQHQRGK